MLSITPEQRSFIEKLIDTAQHEFEQLLTAEEEKNWILDSETDGCKVHKRPAPGTAYYFWKGTRELEGVTVEDFVSTYKNIPENPELLKKLAESFVFSNIKHAFDESKDFVIAHNQVTSGTRLVSDRDFFLARSVRTPKDGKGGAIIVACSIEGDAKLAALCPNVSGVVRGITRFAIRVTPTASGMHMSVVNYADPCGSVPAFLSNRVAGNQGLLPLRYKKHFEEVTKKTKK